MPRYGLFNAGFSQPGEVYKAGFMKAEGNTVFLHSETAPLCLVAAICLKEGQRLQELRDTDAE